jgi:hypothetical protein
VARGTSDENCKCISNYIEIKSNPLAQGNVSRNVKVANKHYLLAEANWIIQ